MRRVLDFRENARECRELARKMPPAHRDQLEQIAQEWERLAEAREGELESANDPER